MIIVLEGIDGAGKSTQAKLLTERLRAEGRKVFTTSWNSSAIVKRATKKAKKTRSLTPMLHALLAAADFADRLENELVPALASDEIVVADRWIYTALARDQVRGVDQAYLAHLYSFVPQPTLCFYIRTGISTALARIAADSGRHRTKTGIGLKFYESGMDLNLSPNIEQSFRLFQAKVAERYDWFFCTLNGPLDRGIVVIDGEQSIESQHQEIHGFVARAMQARACGHGR